MYKPAFDREKAARLWDFGGVDYMNHGSYGACPAPVRSYLQAQREAFLRNPVEYFALAHPKLSGESRKFWAAFTGADIEGVVHLECATLAVNTVMKSLALRGWFREGDEILLTSHGYNACNNVAREIAGFTGAKVVVAEVPFPIGAPAQVTEAVLKAATAKTRLALVDHITSETGLIFPIADIVAGLKARGIETLVDGAHAPAQVPLDLDKLGAAFYTGNGHKWLCGAPGCAFLYVREDFRERIRPLSTSHGANDPNPDVSAFQKAFFWQGTRDTVPWYTPPVAHEALNAVHPGGLRALMDDNFGLLQYGYGLLLDALKVRRLAPAEMMGTMATVILPPGETGPLQQDLRRRDNLSVMIVAQSPQFGNGRVLRISAHAHNRPEQYERLAAALPAALEREKKGELLPLAS